MREATRAKKKERASAAAIEGQDVVRLDAEVGDASGRPRRPDEPQEQRKCEDEDKGRRQTESARGVLRGCQVRRRVLVGTQGGVRERVGVRAWVGILILSGVAEFVGRARAAATSQSLMSPSVCRNDEGGECTSPGCESDESVPLRSPRTSI